MLMSAPAQFSDQEKIVKLWIHESERIYGDRLVSLEHVLAYKALAADVVKKSFARFNMSRYFQPPGQGNEPPLIFCHFAQGYTGERFYDLMPGTDLKKIIEESLKEYNERYVQMNLVLFEDAMKHVCRITRIIYSPGGHALLVGVGGSGKQSLTKLAAFICNFQTVSIKVSSSYSTTDLKADLLNWYNKAGLKDEQFLFLMTDSHITNEKFLVYINDLLSSGEVAELYNEDDKQNIVKQVRPKVKAENKPDTQDDCWAWFVEKVKVNLHMALCFSPV
jgi:dynein heavy chain, axonemal